MQDETTSITEIERRSSCRREHTGFDEPTVTKVDKTGKNSGRPGGWKSAS